ncbi:MAG: hypothetical protein RR977_02330 [Oscillospiraceae bacterium]
MNQNSKQPNTAEQHSNTNRLLEMVGKKLGKDPKELQKQFSEGKYDSVLNGLNAGEEQKLQAFLKNPALAQKIINTPQAQQMLKKILGG